MTSFCVLIVNWNSREDLHSCLLSVESQIGDTDQIVVVDNGSTDASIEMVKSLFPRVELIDAGENLGFAEACNLGLKRSRSDWVFALNNDAALLPGCLEGLRSAARAAGPDVGMLQPRIVFEDRPHKLNSTGIVVYSTGSARDRDFDTPIESHDEEPSGVFCTSAAAAVYRMTMLAAVELTTGVFDRTYFMYFEDVDLGWRARLAGWTALHIPTTAVSHKLQSSSIRWGDEFTSTQCQLNRIRTVLKNASITCVVRGSGRAASTLWYMLKHYGPKGLGMFASAIVGGLAQRSQVSALIAVDRARMESEWFVAP